MIKMHYKELENKFREAEASNNHITGVIVFSKSNFSREYSEESRSYIVSSDNKAFQDGMISSSVYGACLDGSEYGVRLDLYMSGAAGRPWEVEYCYMM